MRQVTFAVGLTVLCWWAVPVHAACPPDSVAAGNACIDTYEASVWRIPPWNSALVEMVQAGTATLSQLTRGGATQLSPSPSCSPGFPRDFPADGQTVQPCRPSARQGDAKPGGLEPGAKGRKCSGRVPPRRGRGGARAQCRARRRCLNLGRDRQRRLPGAAQGRREAGGCAGFRPGCRRRMTAHIVVENGRIDPPKDV